MTGFFPKRHGIIILLLLLLLTIPCRAAVQVSVTLKLDRNEATVADTIRMVVNIAGIQSIDSRPVLKGVDAFAVTPGGTSSRMEIINGKMNASIDFAYELEPSVRGRFTIGPAEVGVKGKVLRSNTATLAITKAAPSTGKNRGPLFLTASLTSPKVFLEEQTIYVLRLYRRMGVSNISLDLPTSEQLSFQQLGEPVKYQSVYKDQPYQVLEVRYALIPTQKGVIGIRPARMTMTVRPPGQRSPFGFFDDSFFSSMLGKQTTVVSEARELTVLPLPREDRPEDFSGLVGSFRIESKLEPQTVKAGESATLTVVLSGRGNVKQIPDLTMPDMDQIKVYADQPVLKEELDAKGLKGLKIMKWALVPAKTGTYTVPPLSVSFFDTEEHRYRTIATTPFNLLTLSGKEPQIQTTPKPVDLHASQTPSKQQVVELGHDILPAHGSLRYLSQGSGFKTRDWFFWFLLLIPMLFYLGVLFGRFIFKQSPASRAAVKTKRAAKMLLQECGKRNISSNRMIAVWTAYFNDRLGLALGTLTDQEAMQILTAHGVSESTANRVKETIRSMEDAVYTGKGDETCNLVEALPELVKQVDKEIQ